MTIKERLRNINTILKGIAKGYHTGNVVEYIMQVYETTMQAATDILSLKYEFIEELLAIDFTCDEQAVEIFKEKGLSKSIIAYVTDSPDKCVPDKEFIVEIFHGTSYRLSASGYNDQCAYFHVPYVTKYLIYNEGATMLPFPALAPCYQYAPNHFPSERLLQGHLKNSVILEYELKYNTSVPVPNLKIRRFASLDYRDPQDISNYSNIDGLVSVWHLSKNYILDSRFLTFQERKHSLKNLDPKTAQHQNIFSDTYELGRMIKIPLIDNVYMETPLGIVQVKETKVLTDWEKVAQWSDSDFEAAS